MQAGKTETAGRGNRTSQIFSWIFSLPNVYISYVQNKLKHQQLSGQALLSPKSNHGWVALLLP